MPETPAADRQGEMNGTALQRRAEEILRARPAYHEMVEFYLTVFRRQITWSDTVSVHPDTVEDETRRDCLSEGRPLLDCCEPGLDLESLAVCWSEMKTTYRCGNEVLLKAIEAIERAESRNDFEPANWLAEQRPNSFESVYNAAELIGVPAQLLGSLARAVALPHWERICEAWMVEEHVEAWQRFDCPTCGSPPALAEIQTEVCAGGDVTPPTRRFFHCPFCALRWPVPAIECPGCGSTKAGDAKYLFTTEEPDLRVDFCDGCHRYVKVVHGDKISGPLHLGLELVAMSHLDVLATDHGLSPLGAGA